MGLFSKTHLQKIIELVRQDEQALAGLETALTSLAPEWELRQQECENFATAILALGNTYQQGVSEAFFQGRDAKLRAALQESIRVRDAITGDFDKRISAAKSKLANRKASVVNAFRGWADAIAPKLSEPSRTELEQARKNCRAESDIEEICGAVAYWMEKATAENSDLTIQVLDWGILERRAAAV